MNVANKTMEVGGFVLRAVALASPTYKLYKDCSALFISTRHCSKDIKRYGDKLSVQQRIFANECELVLSLIVEKDEAISMMEDYNHCQWQDPQFLTKWQTTMGAHFDVVMKTISETLRKVEVRLSKLQSQICANNTARLSKLFQV